MAIYQKRGKWFIDYYYLGRRVRESVGTSKKEAEKALATRKAEILQGRYHWLDEKRTVVFEVLAREYENYSQANKRSWRRDLISLKNLLGFFQGRLLTQINPWMVEKYKQVRLEAGVKPATINRELACLKHMFSLAVRWGKLREHPLRKVKLLHEENRIERILSPDEEARLLESANEPLRTILLVALNTGMRRGEILTLLWSCVDFERALITVINPKSGRSRKIPMNEELVRALKERHEVAGDGLYVFADSRTGKPWGTVKTAFLAALRRANIRGLRFHDLRHTFATRLVAWGVDLLTVKELLGHSSITMTMRYAHPSQENMRRAVELLLARSGDGHHMDTKAISRPTAMSSNHLRASHLGP